MPDDQKKRSVSDISHLFLSNIREINGNGQPPPRRTPPGAVADSSTKVESSAAKVPTSGDLSDEEYAHVVAKPRGGSASLGVIQDRLAETVDGAVAPVTMVLAGHLNERELERTREYARHVASVGSRIGLIDIDVSEFRLYSIDPAVEPGVESTSPPSGVTGVCDPREIAETVEELNADVSRWIVLVPHPRTPEAKSLVKEAEHWVLLCTCDHDGVVAAYRMLKSVADVRRVSGTRPTRLSIAILDAAGDSEAAKVQQKLAGVCRQFLNWEVEAETPVRYAPNVAEHPLMNCRVSRDKAQVAVAPHWQVISEFLSRPRRGEGCAAEVASSQSSPEPIESIEPVKMEARADAVPTPLMEPPQPVRRIVFAEESHGERDLPQTRRAQTSAFPMQADPTPIPPIAPKPMVAEPIRPTIPPAAAAARTIVEPIEAATMRIAPFPMPEPTPASIGPAADEVIELPVDSTGASILSAMLRRPEWGMVECPLSPPNCLAAVRVAVTRDRGLSLLAVASKGLCDLKAIGQAYRWISENQALIAMAVPQFAIDASRTPMLHLLVDQADITGDLLRPIMQSTHVTVRAYRTLRWAGRTGLLLDAA